VVPLYKKREHYHIKNYRPVSILLACSKILEKLMYNRLMPLLLQNNILTEAQNGFRKTKSTVTASQSFIESIQQASDSGLHVTGLFFDLSKAYDVTDHDILLDKLDSYGIRGVSNIWFRSCLLNRCQFVEIKNTDGSVKTSYNSTCRIVKYGRCYFCYI
jgi:hypothetical protein